MLGIHENRISKWFANAVYGRPQRCAALDDFFTDVHLPFGWVDAAIAVWRTLLHDAKDDSERVRLLNNLSNRLSDAGDNAGALEAIRETVEIRRRLSEANLSRFEPDLAMSLSLLGFVNHKLKRNSEAAKAIRESADLIRPYAEKWPKSQFGRVLRALESDFVETEDV